MLQRDINPRAVKLQNYTAHPHKLASPCHPRPPTTPSSTHVLWQEDQTAEWTEARRSYIFQVKIGIRGERLSPSKKRKKRKFGGVRRQKTRVEPSKLLAQALIVILETQRSSCRADGFPFQLTLCILMKKNWFPWNSYCAFVLRC